MPEEPQQQRRRRFSGALKNAPNHPVLDEQLEALRRASRELPTALDRLQSVLTRGSLQQARGQDVGGGNGVLDSQIYPDTADWRHRVSRISNTQQAWPVPNPKAIDSDSQQLDVGPIVEFTDAIAEIGGKARDLPAEGRQAALAYLIEPSLRDHVCALPIVLAIEHHEDPAGIDPAQGLPGIGWTPRQAHPQNVHRSSEIGDREACLFAHYRMAPVGTNDQISANGQAALWGLRAKSGQVLSQCVLELALARSPVV